MAIPRVPQVRPVTSNNPWTSTHYEPRETVGGRVLPYQIIWPTNNTEVACMNQCAAFGFAASGTEVGKCFWFSLGHLD